MSAIAQRRVAGATALMILLYLLQVALYTPTASADHAAAYTSGNPTSECGWQGDGSIPSSLFRKYQYDGDFTSPEGSADVTVALSGGGFTYQNNEFTLEIYRIILKVGQGVGDDVVLGDHNVLQAGELSIPDGLSHVTFCLVGSTPFDVGPCDTETGTRDVSFTVPDNHDLTITDSGEVKVGDYETGPHTVALEPGTYNWYLYSPPGSGTQVDRGAFVVGACEKETTTTTEATTTTTEATTTTTTQPTTTTTEATTTTTTTQPTTTTTEATTTTTEATTTTTEPEEEVLGTTITTVPEVSADTLPFTGSESGDLFKLAMLALAAGALMLFAVRGPKEEDEVATDIGGWSSL